MEEEEKKAFFSELWGLDEESDGVEDTSEVALMLSKSRPPVTQTRSNTQRVRNRVLIQHSNQCLVRTVSTPLLPRATSTSFPGLDRSAKVLSSSPLLSSARALIRSTGNAQRDEGDQTKMTNRRPSKRKRGFSMGTKPESQQIFKDLTFYFLPNNDIAPSRGFRIRKAMEFGALWVREWREGISHVIVDKDLGYADVIAFLKVASLPPNTVLVNEVYPAECVQYRYLVNPMQSQYRVAGHKEGVPTRISPARAPSPATSLQLKPATGFRHSDQTTPRTESSLQDPTIWNSKSLDADNVPETPHVSAPQYPQDALSEAIKEVRVVKGK